MTENALPLEAVAGRLREASLLLATQGPLDIEISGVSQDSRQVAPGDLFLAWKGEAFDAHEYLVPAVRAGAYSAPCDRIRTGPARHRRRWR